MPGLIMDRYQEVGDGTGKPMFRDVQTGQTVSLDQLPYMAKAQWIGQNIGRMPERAGVSAGVVPFASRAGLERPTVQMEPPGKPQGVRFPDTSRTIEPEPPPTGRAPLSAADIRNAGAPLPQAQRFPAGQSAAEQVATDYAGQKIGDQAWNAMSNGMSNTLQNAALGAGAVGAAGYGAYKAMDGEPVQQAQSVGKATAPVPASGVDVGLPPGRPQIPAAAAAPVAPAQKPAGRVPAHHATAVANAAKGTAAVGAAHPAGTQNVAFSPTGTGGVRPNFNYYSEMMNAADAGEAYARDFVNLRENARRSAIEAATRDDKFQFVPITDYRNNRIVLVNANGNDVVLDMNDPYHKAEYSRMLDKIGMNPNEMTAWSMRASRPLLRHFQPGGGQQDVTPDFGYQPGQAQVGAARRAPAQTALADMPIPSVRPQQLPDRKFGQGFMGSHGEPDTDQIGSPSDSDADNMPKPSLSVGDVLRNGASDAEAERRLGGWDYDKEEPSPIKFTTRPNANLDPVQDFLSKDLASKKPKLGPKPTTRTARR